MSLSSGLVEWIWHCQVFKLGKVTQKLTDAKPRSVRIWYVHVVQCVYEVYSVTRVKPHRWQFREMPLHFTKGLLLHPVKDRDSLRNFKSRSNNVTALWKIHWSGLKLKQKSQLRVYCNGLNGRKWEWRCSKGREMHLESRSRQKMSLEGEKVFVLSLTWWIDSSEDQNNTRKAGLLKKRFIFGYTKAKGSVEKFGIYNKKLYEWKKYCSVGLCSCA